MTLFIPKYFDNDWNIIKEYIHEYLKKISRVFFLFVWPHIFVREIL